MAARQFLDEHFSCRRGIGTAAGGTQTLFREELAQFTRVVTLHELSKR
ncbi:MAG: hypothetical protein MUO54_05465 [Anaerolineales bacterium]|nr:hypothetical protein [Anaerolineales bacterium]